MVYFKIAEGVFTISFRMVLVVKNEGAVSITNPGLPVGTHVLFNV